MLPALVLALAAPAALAQHEGHDMQMPGTLGPYPMTREASGTAWQPDAAPMQGFHLMGEEWTLMLHGYVDLVYDRQGGPRGDEKVFVPGMLMAMAQRAAGPGTWGLRVMLSPDPLMGPSGYPLLLQTGETADGVTPLVDRQHPHDAFMELATSYSIPIWPGSVFVYGGLPGEPALGPPAFMHRASGMAIPEAPLSHHWLDSTHVTFGVVTLGATVRGVKIEGSLFNGREPDQHRGNIETAALDSRSVRVSYNQGENWSAQMSRGWLESPEQLEPEIDLERSTGSVSYTVPLPHGHWSSTFAAGVNRGEGEPSTAWSLESTRQSGRLTLFGRIESITTDHLGGGEVDVGKLSLGGSWRIGSAYGLAFDAGGLLSGYEIPQELEAAYGSSPVSGMAFLRTSID
jgi:hypothetical protein